MQYGGYIELTKGKRTLVDPEDLSWLNTRKWHSAKGGKYAASRINGRIVYLHRLLVNAPEGMEVDHVNGDGLDNRKSNLRICTPAQNHYNHKIISTNKTGYRGVHWDKVTRLWVADISIDNQTCHLGYFENIEDAAREYDKKALEVRGEFTRTNFERSEYGTV